MNPSITVPIFLSVFITLCVTIAGGLAFRPNYAKAAHDIRQDLIEAMKEENALLEKKIEHCQEETERLREVIERQTLIIETIQAALKHKGIFVTIDGEMITISDKRNSSSTTRKITLKKEEV